MSITFDESLGPETPLAPQMHFVSKITKMGDSYFIRIPKDRGNKLKSEFAETPQRWQVIVTVKAIAWETSEQNWAYIKTNGKLENDKN